MLSPAQNCPVFLSSICSHFDYISIGYPIAGHLGKWKSQPLERLEAALTNLSETTGKPRHAPSCCFFGSPSSHNLRRHRRARSTECEKWLQEYRNSLKHSPAVHRAQIAHHSLHHYIHRKLTQLKKKPAAPKKPRLLPARHSKPKMTREELLKKLEPACGDLTEDRPQLAELKDGPSPDFLPETHDEEIVLASNDGGFIRLFAPPVYSTSGVTPPGAEFREFPSLLPSVVEQSRQTRL